MPSVNVMRQVKVEFDAIRVIAPVRYDEEDMPNDAPFRKGDTWDVTIRLDDDGAACIEGWPQGQTLDLHMKVVDCGTYIVMHKGKEVGKREQDYVPDCFPGTHYGDYLILDIYADGAVTNWDAGDYAGLIPGDD
jgi:hypothetical protein